jgi:5-methylcytosine-specific restriction enzyme A
MSINRIKKGGWCNPDLLPRGSNGRALCRQCDLEVPLGRRSFCSQICVDEWKLRTDPAFLRSKVFERDRGICANCGIDTEKLKREIRCLSWEDRKVTLINKGFSYEKSFWEADHILPVVLGGGECGLNNIRTLCFPCHKKVTAQLRTLLAKKKRQIISLPLFDNLVELD